MADIAAPSVTPAAPSTPAAAPSAPTPAVAAPTKAPVPTETPAAAKSRKISYKVDGQIKELDLDAVSDEDLATRLRRACACRKRRSFVKRCPRTMTASSRTRGR